MKDKRKFALLPKWVYVVGTEDVTTVIWLKHYYIAGESDYESLNGDRLKENTLYIYPSQDKFTFLSYLKVTIFFCFIFFLYIMLRDWL